MHVRKGDTVVVIAGKDKGKRGKVLRVLTEATAWSSRASTMVKRHIKPTQRNPQGGILEKEGSIHVSNVLLGRRQDEQAARARRTSTKATRRSASGVKSGEPSSSTAGAERARVMADENKQRRRRKADARRRRPRARGRGEGQGRRWQEGRRARWSGAEVQARAKPPRLRKLYEETVRADADEAVQLQEPDAGPAPAEDHDQHGPRRGRDEPEDASTPRSTSSARSPARSRSSPRPRSRSRPSSSARARRSA